MPCHSRAIVLQNTRVNSGRFSAGTFILPVLKQIPRDKTLARRDGASISVGQAISNLQTALQAPMHSMFVNDTKLNDGTVYGIVINKRGVAVHDFASSLGSDPADDVMIQNVCFQAVEVMNWMINRLVQA